MQLFGLRLNLSIFFCGLSRPQLRKASIHAEVPSFDAPTEVLRLEQTYKTLKLTVQRNSLLASASTRVALLGAG